MVSPTASRSFLSLTTILLLTVAQSAALSIASPWNAAQTYVKRSLNKRAENATVIPLPISVSPSQYWDGIDGPWSSFALQLGENSQAQNIRAMISTASPFTWTISAGGCPDFYPSNCSDTRGMIFNTNESSTWIKNSIFNFDFEVNLNMDTNGNAGFDTVTLGWQGSSSQTATVEHSTVFNVQSSTYWLGGFGLNPAPTNFTTFVDPQPSFMQQLKTNNQTPSLSYGYTAGNQYRLNKVYGSLTLGGYDQNRFTPTNVTFPFNADISRDLLVNLHSVTSGNTNLLPSGNIQTFVDSTVPDIWLPEDACKAFEDAFGLVWNESYSRYLMTDSQRQNLLNTNPSVTFTISPNTTDGETVDIELPYAAFDLELYYPYVANPNYTHYFPLQRAANDTQYTLGRTFLQEAYLIADYELQNFTVAPCSWDQTALANQDIITIRSINDTSTDNDHSGGISGGVIGGVVVAIIAVIAILAGLLWFFRRRKRVEKKRIAELEAKESSGAPKDSSDNHSGKPFISAPIGGELGGGEIHELTAPHKPFAQEMESPHKVDPNKAGYSEMEGGEYFGPGKNFAHEMPGSQQPIYEMAGSDVHEMPTSERAPDQK